LGLSSEVRNNASSSSSRQVSPESCWSAGAGTRQRERQRARESGSGKISGPATFNTARSPIKNATLRSRSCMAEGQATQEKARRSEEGALVAAAKPSHVHRIAVEVAVRLIASGFYPRHRHTNHKEKIDAKERPARTLFLLPSAAYLLFVRSNQYGDNGSQSLLIPSLDKEEAQYGQTDCIDGMRAMGNGSINGLLSGGCHCEPEDAPAFLCAIFLAGVRQRPSLFGITVSFRPQCS